jgi:hypothetical protein
MHSRPRCLPSSTKHWTGRGNSPSREGVASRGRDSRSTQSPAQNASNTVTNWGTGDRSHARCTPGFGGVSAEPNPGPHQRPETARGA